MSEEKPSADSDLTSAATGTGSSEAMSVPRQSLGPAVESDGTAQPVDAPTATQPPAAPPTPAVSPAAPITPVTPPLAPAPPRKSRRRLLVGAIFGLIVVVLVAAIGVLVYLRLYGDPTKNAVVGDCLADLPSVAVGEDKEVTSVRVVDCGDPAATHVVEGRLDNKTEAEAKSAEVCQAYQNSTFIYRAVPPGGNGYVLCLKEVAS